MSSEGDSPPQIGVPPDGTPDIQACTVKAYIWPGERLFKVHVSPQAVDAELPLMQYDTGAVAATLLYVTIIWFEVLELSAGPAVGAKK